jgi:hypothetical protein
VPAARAMVTPIAAAVSRVRTTPRRSGSRLTRAPASTAYCQGWVSSRARVTAEPRIAPMAAGPAQAPVDQAGTAGELRAGLAGLVAQADHVVEPLPGGRLHGHGPVAGDVDAVAVPQHRRRVRVQRPGPDAGARGLDPRLRQLPHQPPPHRIGQQPHHRGNGNAWRGHGFMLLPPDPDRFPSAPGSGGAAPRAPLGGRPRGLFCAVIAPRVKISPPQTPHGSRRSTARARQNPWIGQVRQYALAMLLRTRKGGVRAPPAAKLITARSPLDWRSSPIRERTVR